ncbi:hypothetical protein A4A49_26690 [Nicotiana attenuata]|uniref:Uncharacterized protein n=1 Tax=Nicotiana attenuata TaxID=49451 RepID=A0A314LFF4_NICAT|nr:hypothetical protein A4A49_26690 [Nicotiana attenuata]
MAKLKQELKTESKNNWGSCSKMNVSAVKAIRDTYSDSTSDSDENVIPLTHPTFELLQDTPARNANQRRLRTECSFEKIIERREDCVPNFTPKNFNRVAKENVVVLDTKLKVRNIFPTTLEKSSMNVLEFFDDKLDDNATARDDLVHERGDDDFQSPPHQSPKVYIKPKLGDAPGSTNLLAEVKRLSDSQKELKEEFQMIKKELQMLNVFIVESNSKLVNVVESLAKKVNISSASKGEDFANEACMMVVTLMVYMRRKMWIVDTMKHIAFDNNTEENEAPNDELGVYQDADFGAGEAAIDPMEAYYIDVPESQIVKYTNPAIAAKDPLDECYVDVPESQIVKYKNPMASEHTPEYSKRERRPASVYKSPFLTDFSSGASSVRGSSMKTIVTGGHPFVYFTSDDDYKKITSDFKTWVTTGLRTKRKSCVYAKKDNALQPMFEFGVLHVGKKEWFHKLAYKGQSISDSITFVDTLDLHSAYGSSPPVVYLSYLNATKQSNLRYF